MKLEKYLALSISQKLPYTCMVYLYRSQIGAKMDTGIISCLKLLTIYFLALAKFKLNQADLGGDSSTLSKLLILKTCSYTIFNFRGKCSDQFHSLIQQNSHLLQICQWNATLWDPCRLPHGYFPWTLQTSSVHGSKYMFLILNIIIYILSSFIHISHQIRHYHFNNKTLSCKTLEPSNEF